MKSGSRWRASPASRLSIARKRSQSAGANFCRSSRMRARSLHQGSTTPSGITACTVGSAAIMRSPCLSSCKVADDLGPQHARHVGGGGDAAARRSRCIDFLGHRAAADDFAALEHERRKPRAREIERGRQPVVTAADDDDVVALGCHRAVSPGNLRHRRRGAAPGSAGCRGSGLPSARRSRRGSRASACRAARPRRCASPGG